MFRLLLSWEINEDGLKCWQRVYIRLLASPDKGVKDNLKIAIEMCGQGVVWLICDFGHFSHLEVLGILMAPSAKFI